MPKSFAADRPNGWPSLVLCPCGPMRRCRYSHPVRRMGPDFIPKMHRLDLLLRLLFGERRLARRFGKAYE